MSKNLISNFQAAINHLVKGNDLKLDSSDYIFRMIEDENSEKRLVIVAYQMDPDPEKPKKEVLLNCNFTMNYFINICEEMTSEERLGLAFQQAIIPKEATPQKVDLRTSL